jgi:hypothetical protein
MKDPRKNKDARELHNALLRGTNKGMSFKTLFFLANYEGKTGAI